MYPCHTYLLTYLCPVPTGQDFQIREEGTGFQHCFVVVFLHWVPKQDVLLERVILNPGLLGHIGHSTLCGRQWRGKTDRLYEKTIAYNCLQEEPVAQNTQQRQEQRRALIQSEHHRQGRNKSSSFRDRKTCLTGQG